MGLLLPVYAGVLKYHEEHKLLPQVVPCRATAGCGAWGTLHLCRHDLGLLVRGDGQVHRSKPQLEPLRISQHQPLLQLQGFKLIKFNKGTHFTLAVPLTSFYILLH